MIRFYERKKFLLSLVCLLVSWTALAQNAIRGTVKDTKGATIPGVNVKVKEAPQIGTVTDVNGNFVIPGQAGYKTLVISFIGYTTQEAVITNAPLSITLEESATGLNEVIITGYGSAARKDLTGAVGNVNVEDVQKAPVRSFEEALAGRVAGVQVTSQDGKPGATNNIYIRGIGSISQSSSPLYLIDGLAIENPDNNLLDPDNIETISILKDASSTAVFGARGSNGVIVITTKRGKTGPPKITYTAYYGVNKPTKFYKMLTPYEYVKMLSEQLGVGSNPYLVNGFTLEDYRNVKGTDWQDLLINDGIQTNHSASVSGGSGGTLYSFSGNYLKQKGIIVNSGYDRYLGKMTLDQKLGDKAKIGGFLSYAVGTITGTNPQGTDRNSLFYSAYTYRPIPIPGINPDEFEASLYDPSNGSADYRVNPFASAQNEVRNQISNNVLAQLYINYNILKNLKLTLRGNLNSNNIRNETFNGPNTRSGGANSANGINGAILNTRTDVYDNTNLLEYTGKIGEKHRLNVMLGTTIQQSDIKAFGFSALNIPAESMGLSGLDAGVVQQNSSSPVARISTNTMASIFGQANYVFANKYYLTAGYRYDASSKFVSNKGANFPSAAIKWKFSEEEFLKGNTVLSDANIRASYGTTGNNRVGDFDTYSTIRFQDPLYLNGVSQGNSAVNTTLPNPNLKWETNKAADVALDLGFFKNRLNLTVEYYHRRTDGLLYRTPLPGSMGYTSAIVNIASLSNRGLEITLSGDIVTTSNFSYSTNFNITFNRNRLEALADPSEQGITNTVSWESLYAAVPAYISKIGGPLGQMYGYVSDGLYQYKDFDKMPNGTYVLKPEVPTNGLTANRSNIQPGATRYIDINGDGQITADDRTVIGNGYPLHVGGWSNNFTYKNFDANIFFQWSYGNDIINANRMYFSSGMGIKERSSIFGGQNTFAEFANRWTPDNQNTDIPRLNQTASAYYSTQYIEDGSYLRLKTLNIGYSLPSKLLERYKISRLRFYVSANNLFTLTHYKGYDPEVSAFSTGLTPGLDYSTYPRPITITGGVSLTL